MRCVSVEMFCIAICFLKKGKKKEKWKAESSSLDIDAYTIQITTN